MRTALPVGVAMLALSVAAMLVHAGGSEIEPSVGQGSPLQRGPSKPARDTEPCSVARIIDGDTIECDDAGRIRLIGVDTPELSQDPEGTMAAQALADLIPVGTVVDIEGDVEPRDIYGRLLGYVWYDGALVNWTLVRNGWAVLLTYPPNVQYVEWLTAAQRQAREEARGLWAIDGFACLPRDRRRGVC